MVTPIRSRETSSTPAVTRGSTTGQSDDSSAFENKPATDGTPRAEIARSEAAVDRELVRRFNGGDEAAFTEIVTRYREKILALARNFLRNHADAEEIAQDTFIRAHRGLAQFRGDSSLATWLHRVAVNLARNRYWYFFRRRRHMAISLDCPLSAESSGTFSDLVATTDADPARQATVTEFVDLVAVCMGKLDTKNREILGLRNLLHHSYEDIAAELGISEGTVKSRIARARGKLRGLLTEACPEFPAEAIASDWFEPARGAGCAA
jgi:RNA polymerase sigma-70 factor, ECF subfamily